MGLHIRTYEGRVLDRQNEDLEDQGLHFDIGTIRNRVSRRKFFGLLGVGAGTAAIAACSPGSDPSAASSATSSSTGTTSGAAASTANSDVDLTEMNTETAGPYPGDGSNGPDVLEKVGVKRSDIRSSIGGGATASGVPMKLKLNIIDMVNSNSAMTGAAVYVWHCDAEGGYSMYGDGLENETYLRGVQVTSDDGTVEFTTIVPGCYSGRYPHIHFEVFPDKDSISDATNAILTSQIAIPGDVCDAVYETDNYKSSIKNYKNTSLAKDGIFSDGWDAQVPDFTGDVKSGYTLTLDVPIDTTTENKMSGPEGGQGRPGGQGGPGGQPPAGEPPAGEPPAGQPGAESASSNA